MLKSNICSLILALMIVSSAHAERLGPKDVEPVIYDGVKYVAVHWGQARGLDQNGGYVEAFDLKTSKPLWLLRIYKITYDSREKDVQDVFIIKMSMEHGSLTEKKSAIPGNGDWRHGRHLAWSPSGRKIAGIIHHNRTDLVVWDSDGKQLKIVNAPDGVADSWPPVWSADEKGVYIILGYEGLAGKWRTLQTQFVPLW